MLTRLVKALAMYCLAFTLFAAPIPQHVTAISDISATLKPYSTSINGSALPKTLFDTEFQQSVTLANLHEQSNVDFHLSRFLSPFKLHESRFKHNIDFNWVIFFDTARFYRVLIEGSGFFYFTQFKSPTVFEKFRCVGPCIFSHSRAEQLVFNHSVFEDNLLLNQGQFGELLFNDSQLDESLNLSYSVIDKRLEFNTSLLLQGLNLSHSVIKGTVYFNNTDIYERIDLSYITIESTFIDLTPLKTAVLTEPIKLNLMGTNIEKIKLNYLYFKLIFPEEATRADINKIYLSLLKNFKTAGDSASYNQLLAEYHHYTNLKDNHYISDIISKYWWNYSTNPEWIFTWIAILIIIYTTINTLFYEILSTRYFDVPFLTQQGIPYTIKHSFILRFIYSFPRALLFTLLMFFGTQFRMRNGLKEFKSNNIFVNLYFILMIITGMLCMFFLLHYLFAQIAT